MKAPELLEQQHEDLVGLFEQLEEGDGGADQGQLFEELATRLVAHDAIERQIFYPACEEAMGINDVLGEALVEHQVIEFMLHQADQARGKDDFEFKCAVLREAFERHVEVLEEEILPKAKDALDDERLEELGSQMEQVFEEAIDEDFRAPLHENLRQLLAGATQPAPGGDGAARKASRRATQASHAR